MINELKIGDRVKFNVKGIAAFIGQQRRHNERLLRKGSVIAHYKDPTLIIVHWDGNQAHTRSRESICYLEKI